MSINCALLASGHGTNAENLLRFSQSDPFFNFKVLITDRPNAPVLKRLEYLSIPMVVIPFEKSKQKHEEALLEVLANHQVDWVMLAGYRRLLSPWFIQQMTPPGQNLSRVLNIHPSLLPAFPGLHAYERAYQAGVNTSGVTIHFVDQGMDTGPILAQACFVRYPDDTLERFITRGMSLEYQLYPEALKRLKSFIQKEAPWPLAYA